MDPLIIGRVAGVFGLKGWVKVHSFTRPREHLLSYESIYLEYASEWRKCFLKDRQQNDSSLRILLTDCNDRDSASELIGARIGILRDDLPSVVSNEYYWADLIGLEVFNLDNEFLGKVLGLLETGAHDVLEVGGEKDYLIPFVQNVHVLNIDLTLGTIRVDWHVED